MWLKWKVFIGNFTAKSRLLQCLFVDLEICLNCCKYVEEWYDISVNDSCNDDPQFQSQIWQFLFHSHPGFVQQLF